MDSTKMSLAAFTFLLLSILQVLVSGSPLESPGLQSLETQSTSYPRYRYAYRINDPAYGNFQEKYESRDGDVVQGHYSLLEPNGLIRIVEYTADESGFHAQVSHKPSGDYAVKLVAAP